MAKSKTYAEVIWILEQNEPSFISGVSPRDSDQELIIQMIQRIYDADLGTRQMAILRRINFESITRCRRKLQENGEFLPSPEVAKARRLKGYEVQQTAPKESSSGLQNRIERNMP